MEIVTAEFIGSSHGAYEGRTVDFITQGIEVSGTLGESYISPTSDIPLTHLFIDGTDHAVNSDTEVEVY